MSSLSHQMLKIRIVFVADELADFFGWCQLGDALEGIRAGEHSWIFDGNLRFEMSEIRATISLDHVEPVAVRVRFLIKPHVVHEIDPIDYQRVAFPVADGVSVPEQIRLLR